MICPHCGYEKNTEDALYCNLCHVVFRKKESTLQEKNKQEITADKGATSTKGITSFADLPDELKATLLKEKETVIHSSQNNFIDSKKMMLLGVLLVLILLIVGGMFVLLPVVKTMLTKGQG